MQCGVDKIATLGFVDFNCPSARQKNAVQSLVSGLSIVNDSGIPTQNASMLLLPDLPKESSLRGLFDEEKAILEQCFGLRQHCETRFVDLYTRERRGDRSNMRRFGSGRLVVQGDSVKENFWLNSELAVCGRPTSPNEFERGAPTSILPKSTSLLLPEGSSPNTDLKLAERSRPSPEQSVAQKGTARLELLLESALRHTSFTNPILIINFTGYVEELATSVP